MTWKQVALEHAKQESPKESCGLLIIKKGKEVYYPCNNLAVESEDLFIIDPVCYAKADDSGEIVGVVHSHPKTSPEPSQADKVACEKSKLPWYIVQPDLEEWVSFKPCGYKAPLIGRKYCWKVCDCWSVVRDWYAEEKNIILKDWDRPNSAADFIRNPMFEGCYFATGFRELTETEELQEGDLLLMSVKSKGLNHIAVYLGGNSILHHLANRLSSRDQLDEWLLKCIGKRIRYVA